MNIGVLFPRSNVYPLMGAEFMEGLKAIIGIEKLNDIKFIPESIGFGGSEKEVYTKAEKLLMIDDVDVLVGFIDEKILVLLKPLIMASSKLFIVVNAGANHPVNWIPQANIITLCLQHSFLCAVNGSDAANNEAGNVPAAVASSFYDCGYLHLSAMVREFQSSGGKIAFNYINNQPASEKFNIIQLVEFLTANSDTQTLLCVFDTKPAAGFYTLVNELDTAEQLQLFVSPMMLEKNAFAEMPSGGFNFPVQGYMPWHVDAPNENNKHYVGYFRQQLKKEPGIFSLLGWETGIVITEILALNNDNYRDGNQVVETLKGKVLKSPRGSLQLDAVTNYFLSPAIRITLPARSMHPEFEYAVNLENEWEEFIETEIEGHVSGWTNTYLCY